ncbi:MAG: nucleotidyltransferase [Firmicutes bacterium]|nr:nucleotidyltransferase [Bacillota bacterium]
MKILGITAEYNPFHNGHLYHMNKAREAIGADYTVIAMSGNFMQRGEPALIDKWARSRCAVEMGADIVAEIPFIFSCSRAEHYAKGAVDLLSAMGVTHIAFGCEAENASELIRLAGLLEEKKADIEELVKDAMKDGVSRAKATEAAVRILMGDDMAGLMLSPNNILAIEYIKRINWWKAKGRVIELLPIKREGSGYYDVNEAAGYAGASEIRRMVRHGDLAECEAFAPKRSLDLVGDADASGRDKKLFELIRYQLIRDSEEELAGIYGIGEGIENRMKKASVSVKDYDELIDYLVSKRYSAAAIRRMLCYVLMGLRKCQGPEEKTPEYIRLLAASAKGRKLIKLAKKEEIFDLPLITNINKTEITGELKRDVKAADVYNIISSRDLYDHSDHVLTPYIEI